MSSETVPEYSERVNSRISLFNIQYIIVKLEIIIDQLDIHLANAKNLILEIARILDEGKLCKQSQICRKIKELLEDKIKAGKLSEKWIEECLPQEYKRKYTTNKSEVSSLSKQGNSTTNEQALLLQKKELEQSFIGKKAIVTADQISANERELRIPKDKYPQLKAAMDDSINSVYVMFDKSGVLERAEPDTSRT